MKGKTPEKKTEHSFKGIKKGLLSKKFMFILCIFSLFLLMSPVSAETYLLTGNETALMDLSGLVTLVDQVGGLMPSFGNLAIAVVPIVFIFIIIGFVTGLLDGLLDMIRSVLK